MATRAIGDLVTTGRRMSGRQRPPPPAKPVSSRMARLFPSSLPPPPLLLQGSPSPRYLHVRTALQHAHHSRHHHRAEPCLALSEHHGGPASHLQEGRGQGEGLRREGGRERGREGGRERERERDEAETKTFFESLEGDPKQAL